MTSCSRSSSGVAPVSSNILAVPSAVDAVEARWDARASAESSMTLRVNSVWAVAKSACSRAKSGSAHGLGSLNPLPSPLPLSRHNSLPRSERRHPDIRRRTTCSRTSLRTLIVTTLWIQLHVAYVHADNA